MRRVLAFCLAVLALAALGGCSVRIDYGHSELYSRSDMDSAILEIRLALAKMDGCVLHSLQYAGDEVCAENLAYCRQLAPERDLQQCIVFNSSFRSPPNGGGAWEPNREYRWTWYLGRGARGGWVILTCGYA